MKRKKSIKKKENFITSNYKQSWKYIRESSRQIKLIILIFLLFSALGFIFPIFFKERILDYLANLSLQVQGKSFFNLLKFILLNNIVASLSGLAFGLILAIPPIINAITNGYVLGFVSNIAVRETGPLALLKILPHGIFELPALFLSLALGLKIGLWIFQKKKKKYLIYNLKNSLRVFLLVIIPLLIIAGIIETGLMFLLG